MDALMAPDVVAVVGAADDPATLRGRPLSNLLRSDFAGKVYAVHPAKGSVQGVPAFPSLTMVPDRVDTAVIMVPADVVPSIVEDCAAAGVRAAVVFSGGFSGSGSAGDALQRRVVETARTGGVRLLGPNCLGLVNFQRNVPLTFASYFSEGERKIQCGPIAVVTQSGSYGNLVINTAFNSGIGLSHFISTGNEADLKWSDFVLELADDPSVSVIAGYLEAVRDGAAFIEAIARSAENGKQVVLLKVGRSERATSVAASHTGAIAGDDAAFDAVVRKFGVHRVDDLHQLVAKCQALTTQRRGGSGGRRVGLVTVSGGLAASLADQAMDLQLDLPPLSARLQARLGKVIPGYGNVVNPIDGVDSLHAQPEAFAHDVIGALLTSGEVDAVGFFIGSNSHLEQQFAQLLSSVASSAQRPLICSWIGGSGAFVEQMNQQGIPAFANPTDAMTALRALADATPAPWISGAAVAESHTEVKPRRGRVDLLGHLETNGLPVVKRVLFGSAAELREFVPARDHSVFVKASLPGVAHKSDAGGVLGPIAPQQAASALAEFAARFADLNAFEVQDAVPADWELMVGVRQDALFGPIVVIGFGGLLANVVRGSVTFAMPLSITEFESRLRSSDLGMVFSSYRGLASADIVALYAIVQALVSIVLTEGLEVLETNPVIVERGTGQLRIVDALADPWAP
jgi:acetate---CoA ligase (ADP-forming)